MIAGIKATLAAAWMMNVLSGSQSQISNSNDESTEPSKEEWMEWLEKVQTGEYESRLVMPGCEEIDKGGKLQHLLTRYGYSDAESVVDDRFYYQFDSCTYYEKDNKNTGDIFSVGNQVKQWGPSPQDIMELLGNPEGLSINANERETRALYQILEHHLLFIYEGEDENEQLTQVEIGEISPHLLKIVLSPQERIYANDNMVELNLPQPDKEGSLDYYPGESSGIDYMTESAHLFLEELVLSVKEWSGYAPGCTMLEAGLTAESLVGLLGPPDAVQSENGMQKYTYGKCEFYVPGNEDALAVEAIASEHINTTVSKRQARQFLGIPDSKLSRSEIDVIGYNMDNYSIDLEFMKFSIKSSP
ncbi:hypothetical protein ACE1TI_17015 [Alteribacillus sp. JSM 102045]|uniref:hypothetical protein n=1 Tax=Alteribacillus sp. JSM 102045 TaxID=1562101 RepID=UPI0035C0A3CE